MRRFHMKTAHHRFAVAILALLVLPVPAWGAVAEEDPIKAELDAARKVYADAVAAAKATLLKAFDDEMKKVAATGDLDGYKALQTDKKRAMRGINLPRSHPMHKHQFTGNKKISEARRPLVTALKTAVKKYTMDLKINKATAVQSEWKNHLATINREAVSVIRRFGGSSEVDDKRELASIRLYETKITDDVLAYLQERVSLKWLGLGETKITDAGLVHLKGLRNLQYLDLNHTKVTDAGLPHLKGLTNLEVIDFSSTKVTRDGVKKLQQALPKCKIYR